MSAPKRQSDFIIYPYNASFAKTQSASSLRILLFILGIILCAGLALVASFLYLEKNHGLLTFGLLALGILVSIALIIRIHLIQVRKLVARYAVFFEDPNSGRFFYCMAEPDPSHDLEAPLLHKNLELALAAYLKGQRPAEGPPGIWEIAPRGYQGARRGFLTFDIRDQNGKRRLAEIPDAFPGIPEAMDP